jgi:Tol biopolymer transport system component
LATIDPRGSATNYWLEWGTSTEYGHVTTATAVANENGEQSETVSLSGLEPCTTYHYQALAENEANEGTPSLGGDRTFKTRCEVGIFLARDGVGTPTELWEVKADGSGAHSLGAPPEGEEPSLSPDGSLIAYASNKYPYPPEIRIRGVGGGSSSTIYTYSSGGASIDWPRWSPDGTKLIFSVTIYGGERHTLIDSINADGTGVKTLVTIPGPHLIFSFPSYSPDGSKITFFAPAPGGGVQIDVANADGSNVHAITDPTEIEPEEQPRFSPDGTKIAFSGALLGLEYNQRIYTINTDGSDLTEVTHGFTEASEEWAFEPEWTPDGSKIVYAYELGTTNKLQKYELYAANADGSGEATPFLPSLSGVTESWGMSFAP